jgi:hypothetical protein
MVEVRYKDRLGNNLFQYCFGRILAEELGFALQADAIPGFPNTTQRVAGSVHEGPEQVLTGMRVPLEGILADRSPRHIILDGWFQDYRYYRPRRQKIREWLAFDPAIRVPEVQPGLVVNVRRTDYIQRGWALPFSYYEEAIKRLLPQGGSVWIVTDDAADPFFRRFKRWEPRLFRGNDLEQLLFMTRAPRLVMSQSTFSWWPTFLAEQQEVACPLPGFGCWAEGPESPDGALIERDRFQCFECPEPYESSRRDRLRQRRRRLKRRIIMTLNRDFGFRLAEPPW